MNDHLGNYWASLSPPLAPSESDVEIFRKNLIDGSCLLLGSTKQLLSLCDNALDIEPLYSNMKIIRGDWVHNNTFYSNIIGDGVLNFNKELCNQVISMAQKNCQQLLVRSFNYRMSIMRVASYFPSIHEFEVTPELIYQTTDYSFYKWRFI